MSLKRLKIILPHIGLVTFVLVYIVLGAAVFYALEKPTEDAVKRAANEKERVTRLTLLTDINQLTERDGISREQFETLADELLDDYIKYMMHSFAEPYEYQPNQSESIWTWSSSIYFSATTLTTIGFGTPAPVTSSGRVFCILYGLFGIPVTLVTMADLAKFLANFFLNQYISIASWRKRCLGQPGPAALSVPVKSAFCLLLIYPFIASVFLCWWEQWTFIESLYFSYVSTFAIGFGDVKPTNDKFFLTILVTVMGLVITTMCIDLVAGFYIDKVHFFGRQLSWAKVLAQLAMSNAAGKFKGLKTQLTPTRTAEPFVPIVRKKQHRRRTPGSIVSHEETDYLLSDSRPMKYCDSSSSLDIMAIDEYY